MPKLSPWLREFLVFSTFIAFTMVMTWPWATNLRDAVSDTGDPYMIAWTLWWDYHQTFHDPLKLFHANIFYPYLYTLAFSEHDYGVALIFFPLFAIGLRPLTVHSIATFTGFAFCGYGAFRLARTLTSSSGAGWIAGIIFAFIPYRFQLLSHLHYLFAGWIPLLLEALVLFARVRSWRRAIWLGIAFLMNGLTCITWLILTSVPLALSACLLIVWRWHRKENSQWMRSIPALALASLLLLPFLWPYYKVSHLYNFKWPPSEAMKFSAGLSDWLSADPRTKVWRGFGASLPGVTNHLFPGLLTILLAVAAVLLTESRQQSIEVHQPATHGKRWLFLLDLLILTAAVIAILAAGYRYSGIKFFAGNTTDRALFVLTILIVVRLSISYPKVMQGLKNKNLISSVRSLRQVEGFWLAMVWTIAGFFSSLGMSIFLNRVLNDLLVPYRSLRIPARAAMVCYVGLSLLAGIGTVRLAKVIAERRPAIRPWQVYSILVVALLFELHAVPLTIVHGAVDPDSVSLRLKHLPMRGGVVELPGSTPYFPLHLAMLRSADHERPLINAASTFVSPISNRIDELVKGPGINLELLDLLEQIPASYVVFRQNFVSSERRGDFEKFFKEATASGRLRLVGVYDDNVLLFVVEKTEGEVQ